MKKGIHPKIFKVNTNCSCGNNFILNISLNVKDFRVEVCNECHPFFTGKQKIIDVSGRVDGFYKKFGKLNKSRQ